MRLLVLMVAMLSGCASTPDPVPPVLPAPVLCLVPGEMTGSQARPEKPTGDYSQQDVADYLNELHRWAITGWLKVQSIKQWSDDCVHRERLRTSRQAYTTGH